MQEDADPPRSLRDVAADERDEIEPQLRYAWDWFQYHAGQRLTAFNFFLILTSAVIVGYANAFTHHSRVFGVAVAALGAVVALGFLAMDIRNAELVEYGQQALARLERKHELVEVVASNERRDQLERVLREGVLGNRLYVLVRRRGAVGLLRRAISHRTWLHGVILVIGVLSLGGVAWAAAGFP